jgi:hypothetical protein
MLAPGLMDRKVGRSAWGPQISDTPEDPARPDNLYVPPPGDPGVRGRFGDKAKPKALILNPQQVRGFAAAGLAAGAAMLLGMAGARALGRRRF